MPKPYLSMAEIHDEAVLYLATKYPGQTPDNASLVELYEFILFRGVTKFQRFESYLSKELDLTVANEFRQKEIDKRKLEQAVDERYHKDGESKT